MSTRMLYRCPSTNKACYGNEGFTTVSGVKYDYLIVEEGESAEGYSETTAEASYNLPPTREELEQKANELSIPFRSDISDAALLKKIEENIEQD